MRGEGSEGSCPGTLQLRSTANRDQRSGQRAVPDRLRHDDGQTVGGEPSWPEEGAAVARFTAWSMKKQMRRPL
jgi:hypothetical protein